MAAKAATSAVGTLGWRVPGKHYRWPMPLGGLLPPRSPRHRLSYANTWRSKSPEENWSDCIVQWMHVVSTC